MVINCDEIGLWAGKVWEAINTADALSTKQIKKIAKLKDKQLFAALGWLAREGKVSFQIADDDEKEILVQLVQ